MGISVKHVTVVATIFGCVGFVYVLGFAPIDPSKSPRAAALNRVPSMQRLITNVRAGMTNGQDRSALAAGDELGERFGDDPQAVLNQGYAYRIVDYDTKGQIIEGSDSARACWTRLVEMMEEQDFDSMTGAELSNALYLRGWGLRGAGRLEESRADFATVAQMTEEANGGMDSGFVEEASPAAAYNLACYWGVGGDLERAMRYWKISVEGGNLGGGGGWWRVDPDFEELRLDEQFWEIGEGQTEEIPVLDDD